MQIDYKSPELNNDTHMLQTLMKDLFERKPEVRYDQLCNQLRDKIMVKAFFECKDHSLFKKHIRVVVDFKEPAGDFSLDYSVEPIFTNNLDDYGRVFRDYTDALLRTLRKEHNLDDVELVEIKVYEYHDIAKGF